MAIISINIIILKGNMNIFILPKFNNLDIIDTL